jgi:hypothetical protein
MFTKSLYDRVKDDQRAKNLPESDSVIMGCLKEAKLYNRLLKTENLGLETCKHLEKNREERLAIALSRANGYHRQVYTRADIEDWLEKVK